MKQTKLYLLLKTFTVRERNHFKTYVFSPYFNKNKHVYRLCEVMVSAMAHSSQKEISKKSTYHLLFKKETFNELKFNNIISDLLQLLYDFLAAEEYKKDELVQMNYLGKAMLKRELYEQVKPIERKYGFKRKNTPYQNAEHYLTEYYYFETLDLFSMSGGAKRKHNEYLQLKNDHLDTYYLADKLRIACDMESRNLVINANYQPHFIEILLKRYEAEESKYSKLPALHLYYTILKMLRSEHDNRYYYSVKKDLETATAFFPKKELQTIYDYLLNYCIRKINSGEAKFYKEILSLYQFLLSKNILLVNAYLTQWNYTNITTTAIRLQEFDWAENFIHTYKKFLLPSEQLNVFTYNLTAFYYAKKDFTQALQLLNTIEFTDAFYHASAKITQLKVYFELNETEAFYALVEAFKQFIRRNKQLSSYHKKANLNFIKASYWTYTLRLKQKFVKKSEQEEAQKKLWQKIEKLDPLVNKVWLKNMVSQIIKPNI